MNDLESGVKTIIENIILDINNLNWDKAREIWINYIFESNDRPFKRDGIKQLSLYGSEVEYFVKYMVSHQKHELWQKCGSNCINNLKNIISYDSEFIFFKKENNRIKFYSCFSEKCTQCGSNIISEIKFIKKPSFVYIQSIDSNIYIHDLPKVISIENCTYRFLYCIVHRPGYFLGIFEINSFLYVVDDITGDVRYLQSANNQFNQKETDNFHQ